MDDGCYNDKKEALFFKTILGTRKKSSSTATSLWTLSVVIYVALKWLQCKTKDVLLGGDKKDPKKTLMMKSKRERF